MGRLCHCSKENTSSQRTDKESVQKLAHWKAGGGFRPRRDLALSRSFTHGRREKTTVRKSLAGSRSSCLTCRFASHGSTNCNFQSRLPQGFRPAEDRSAAVCRARWKSVRVRSYCRERRQALVLSSRGKEYGEATPHGRLAQTGLFQTRYRTPNSRSWAVPIRREPSQPGCRHDQLWTQHTVHGPEGTLLSSGSFNRSAANRGFDFL